MGFFPQFPGFGGRANVNQNVTVKKGADVGGLLGGTPMDDGQALSLGILQAMPALQQAGYERSASPIGSIAKNLIPLFGAMIYAKAAQQQAAAQQQEQELQNELVKSQIIEHLAKARGGAEKPPTSLKALLAQRVQSGQPYDDVMAAMKASEAPQAKTTIGLIQGANPGADDATILKKLGEFNTQKTAADTTARTEAANKVKVRLPDQDRGEYVQMTTGISSMGDILDQLETPGGAPSRMSGAISKLSGGMISGPFWRKYAAFRNDVINKRFKSRFTGPEGEALAQELPDPMSYAADPEGFLKSVRVAYDHAQGILKKTYQFDTDAYDMGPEVTMGVLGATAPRGKAKRAGAAQGGSKTNGPTNTVDSLINEVYGQ